MKNYEKPIVLVNEDLAEGIYAASGAIDYDNDPECWTLGVDKAQVVAHEGYANFRVAAVHPTGLQHISTKTKVVIAFNQPITSAYFDSGDTEVSGCTVTITRERHANAYGSRDDFNSLLKVYAADAESLSVLSANIYCTHAPNVQGGFD